MTPLLDELKIISIIKTSSTGPSGKNRVVYKLISQPHKHLRHGKMKKTQLREATVEPIERSGVKHSVGKVIYLFKLTFGSQ